MRKTNPKRTRFPRKWAIVALAVIITGSAIVGGYFLSTQSSENFPTPAIWGTLIFSNPPALGQTATLTYRMENIRLAEVSIENGEVFSTRIVLPEGLVWVSGGENSLIWENRYLIENIRLFENVPAEISGVVKAVEIGKWTLEAFVTDENAPLNMTMKNYGENGFHGYDGGALIGIEITENSAWITEYDWSSAPMPHSPMNVTLTLSGDPLLNSTVELRTLVSSIVDAPNTTVEITLPKGFVLIDGATQWSGNLYNNSSIELNATVKAVEPGSWVIQAWAKSQFSDGTWFGGLDQLYILLTEENVLVSHAMPVPSTSSGKAVKLENLDSPTQSCDDKLPDIKVPRPVDNEGNPVEMDFLNGDIETGGRDSTLTIMGRFYFINENDQLQGLKWATVKIFDSEWWGPIEHLEYLGSTLTDEDGYFTFGPIPNNDDGWFDNGNGLDIVVYMVADTDAVWVSLTGVYESRTETFPDCPDGILDIGGWTPPTEHEGAWRVFEYTTNAWDYLANGSAQYTMEKAHAVWPFGDWPCFDAVLNIIYIPGGLADSCPDVAQHEYGHFVMDTIYGWTTNPPVGSHVLHLESNSLTAWIEGWADFFPLAVQNEPILSYLVSYNIENRSGVGVWDFGDLVEGNVAAALWDIFDTNNEGLDQISLSFGSIWSVFSTHEVDSFSEFWDAWRGNYWGDAYMCHFPKVAIWWNTINYDLWPPICTITPISGWQTGPVTISALALDFDWEDQPYLSVTFRYSTTGAWPGVIIGTVSSPPYNITWDSGGLYDDSVWIGAWASDGMRSSQQSTTGPFGVCQFNWTETFTGSEIVHDGSVGAQGRDCGVIFPQTSGPLRINFDGANDSNFSVEVVLIKDGNVYGTKTIELDSAGNGDYWIYQANYYDNIALNILKLGGGNDTYTVSLLPEYGEYVEPFYFSDVVDSGSQHFSQPYHTQLRITASQGGLLGGDGGSNSTSEGPASANSLENINAPTSENSQGWVEAERGRDYIDYINELTGEHQARIYPGPIHTWDGARWVSYVFEEKGDYYQVKHPLASARFYPAYTEFWGENFTEARISDERWAVEYLSGGEWLDAGFWGIELSYEVVNENEIHVVRTGATSVGALQQIYKFTQGSPVKIELELTASQDTKARFVWRPSGIAASNEFMGQSIRKKDNALVESSMIFLDEENKFMASLSWYDEIETVDEILISCLSNAEGKNAEISFGDFDLRAGEMATLDPFINEYSILDGYIQCIYKYGEWHYNVYDSGPWMDVGAWEGGGYGYGWARGYFKFNISNLWGSDVIDAKFHAYLKDVWWDDLGGTGCLLQNIEDIGSSLDVADWDKNVRPWGELGPFIGTVNSVGHWSFEEGFVSTAYDRSGKSNNGTINGTIPVSGKIGWWARDFDGMDDRVDVPNSSSLNVTNELTMEAWVKLDNPSADQKIVGKAYLYPEPGKGAGYVMGVVNGHLYPEIWDSNKNVRSFALGTINPNEWTHLAVTWQTGGRMIGYINGNVVENMAASSLPIGTNSNPLRIGCAPWDTNQFKVNGVIDDVCVYARALSSEEILQRALGELNGYRSKYITDAVREEVNAQSEYMSFRLKPELETVK